MTGSSFATLLPCDNVCTLSHQPVWSTLSCWLLLEFRVGCKSDACNAYIFSGRPHSYSATLAGLAAACVPCAFVFIDLWRRALLVCTTCTTCTACARHSCLLVCCSLRLPCTAIVCHARTFVDWVRICVDSGSSTEPQLPSAAAVAVEACSMIAIGANIKSVQLK